MKKSYKGFAFIEVIITITLIAIILPVAVTGFISLEKQFAYLMKKERAMQFAQLLISSSWEQDDGRDQGEGKGAYENLCWHRRTQWITDDISRVETNVFDCRSTTMSIKLTKYLLKPRKDKSSSDAQ